MLEDLWIPEEVEPHSLQIVVEDIVEGMPDAFRRLYYLRFGERRSIRSIAKELGFKSHYVVQYKLEKLLGYVKMELEKRGITYV